MGKLYDLLYAIIDRVNRSVKTTAQAFSEEEKTQVRTNIGAMPSAYVPPNQTAQQVGADPKGTAASAVSGHDQSKTAHADIRQMLAGKVNTADIADDLTTSSADKVLSARQGAELLKLIQNSGGSGGGSGVNLDSAEVGQLIVVEAVDADGQPIKWRAVDRTHYKEVIGQDVAVLAETSVRFTNSTATVSGFVAGAIKEGLTYTVNWNGTEYPCKAYLDDGIVHLGNSALAGGSVTTSDPFCIVGAGATCMVFKNTENTETITLKVDGVAQVVYHKLPQEYLPDGVPYCADGGMTELPVTGEWTDNDGFAVIAPIGLEIGNTYVVNWDGTEYEVVGQDLFVLTGGQLQGVLIGNPVGLGGNDTGEPFTCIEVSAEIAEAEGVYGMIGPVAGDVTISYPFTIYGKGEEIRKLDNRCLDMDYLGAVLGSSAVTLNLVELGMGTASYGAPAQLQQGLRDYVGKIVDGAKVRLIFKYNIGNNEETYDGYVTDWKIDAKWYSAVARIPLGTMSGYFNFATIYMDTETSYTAVSIQRFAESAT